MSIQRSSSSRLAGISTRNFACASEESGPFVGTGDWDAVGVIEVVGDAVCVGVGVELAVGLGVYVGVELAVAVTVGLDVGELSNELT